MNRAFALLLGAALLAAGSLAAPPQSRTGSVAGVWISGREYVKVNDWVAERGLKLTWVKRDELLQADGGNTSIRLRVDSAESKVNGVSVWLLFAVRKYQNGIYISRLDARST